LYSTFVFGTTGAPEGGFLAEEASRLGSAPNAGWFGYAPNTEGQYSVGTVLDYWSIGLQIIGLASLMSSVNLITTIFNLRAKGMRLLRMPVFAWMSLVVNFLLMFSIPIIAVALFMITFDRQFGSQFFQVANGGDPILWQHLFWLFGHPEVYILILPAMGIVSEVLPVFSRKPLFGYAAVVFAGAAIGFLGFGVWAHHMFSSGISPVAQAAFGLSTMTIAIPTGIKIFNWLGTMWMGRLRFNTPMLFSVGFVAMFTIGGLSGVTHSIVPADWQQTDTYYIVAHFHYVLFGGAIFGIFSGLYYWFPKLTGRMYSEKLGKWHFWLMFLGFNLTFAPMHWLGLQGMVRRTWQYASDMNLGPWNMVVTIGAFIIALSILIFMWNWVVSKRRGVEAGIDPWDARTLEWTIPSPPPEYNFAEIPTVVSLDDFWHSKYSEDDEGRAVRRQGADALIAELEHKGNNPEKPIHLPAPSYFPILIGISIMLVGYGIVYNAQAWGLALLVAGILGAVTSFIGWAQEPAEEPGEEEPDGEEH
jgi:cytochrome c oxidase subunit 1